MNQRLMSSEVEAARAANRAALQKNADDRLVAQTDAAKEAASKTDTRYSSFAQQQKEMVYAGASVQEAELKQSADHLRAAVDASRDRLAEVGDTYPSLFFDSLVGVNPGQTGRPNSKGLVLSWIDADRRN